MTARSFPAGRYEDKLMRIKFEVLSSGLLC